MKTWKQLWKDISVSKVNNENIKSISFAITFFFIFHFEQVFICLELQLAETIDRMCTIEKLFWDIF